MPKYTVAQLISKLEEYPKSRRVTVDGYEGGVTESIIVEETKVRPHARDQVAWYYGEHEQGADGTLTVLNLGRWGE